MMKICGIVDLVLVMVIVYENFMMMIFGFWVVCMIVLMVLKCSSSLVGGVVCAKCLRSLAWLRRGWLFSGAKGWWMLVCFV